MSAASAAKEALCVVIDVSRHMRPHLDDALEAVRMLVNAKILFHKQDVVGLVLHGTQATENTVAAEYGGDQYMHITETHAMAPVSYRTLEALDRTAATPVVDPEDSADLIDSLCVGMFAVIAYVKKLKFAKRVILLTDGTSPATAEGEDGDQLDAIARQLKESQIRFEVFGIGIGTVADDADDGTAAAEEEDSDPIAAARKATLRVLRRLETAVGHEHFKMTPMSDAREALGALKKRSVRSSTCFRGPLDIGGIGLPVWSWRKVVAATPPSYKTVAKAALDDPTGEGMANPEGTVIVERRQLVPSRPDDDVPPDQIISAYRFGKDLVPIDRADGERLKLGVPSKTLQLFGLVPRADVPRWMLTSRPECVVPPPEGTGGCDANKALQALLLVLEEEGLVAVARYAPRAGAPPTLVALLPHVTCFWMLQVPFADEMKHFDWGAPPSSSDGPSAAQVQAAAELIDAFDLTPDGEGWAAEATAARAAGALVGGKEPLKPKQVYNPRLQRHYQCIQHRARAMIGTSAGGAGGTATASHLPSPDWRITTPLVPDAAMLQRAAPAIDAFAAACPLSGAVGGKRGRGGRAGATGSGAADAAPPYPKVPRSEEVSGFGASFGGGLGGGGSGGFGGGSGVALQLGYTAPSRLDPQAPVKTFWEMMDDQGEDRVADALDQMAQMVLDLLRSVGADETDFGRPHGPGQKGLSCLRELRRASVREYSAKQFNRVLTQLRELYRDEASGRAFVWRAIVAQIGDPSQLKHGLIVHEEICADEYGDGLADEETVSREQARAFWQPLAPAAPDISPLAAEPLAAVDEMDEDLDALE
jgi:hypothetical protein